MIRSYVYLSRTKVESILAQAEARGPRVSKVDLKVAAVELADKRTDPPERLLARAEQELAADRLISDLDTAGPAQYFYGAMLMHWGRVNCDWGDVGPEPTVMFISGSASTQVALYGSLRHMIGHENVEGSTTGSYGFVLWDLIHSRLTETEPGLVDGGYHGISAGRQLLDRWSQEKKQYETHTTLGIVRERMHYNGYFEFLAIVHTRFDCSRADLYRAPARWVIGSPLFVARATPPTPTQPIEALEHDELTRPASTGRGTGRAAPRFGATRR